MHWPAALEPEDVPAGTLPKDSKKTSKGNPQISLEYSEDHVATWKAMEELVDEGLVKSIGVSNFNIRRLKALLPNCRIKPVADQVELSFGCPQPELIAWLQKNDILPQAYSPLGSTGASHANEKAIDDIAKKHGVEGANVLISWQVARGCNPLPKSVTPKRIANNLKLVDLTKEELESLEKAAASKPKVRVCDQSEDFEWDIFQSDVPGKRDEDQKD